MSTETEYITKTYYQTLLPEGDSRHPIAILGDAFMAEQEKEPYDLSFIRFAQGEVYFHHKDYEAAIYKWESIANELAPWAKKNIADAYYELGLLSNAEEVYGSILSKNKVLNSEVSLNLFSLYLEDKKLESAYRVIQEAVSENPDYPNLTAIAKRFYEEQEDWQNAMELALSETLRKDTLEWFDVLISYSEAGHSSLFAPDTFIPVLRKLYKLDQPRFKQLTMFIWKSYQETSHYLEWLHAVNQILKDLEIDPYDSWHVISNLFKEAYLELTNGKYLLRDIGQLTPKLLIHWFNLTPPANGLTPAAAILAWNDIFPSTIKSVVTKEAEIVLEKAQYHPVTLEECKSFMRTIIDWAKQNNIETSSKLIWGYNQLFNEDAMNILVLGKGKAPFINSILDEEIIVPSLSNFLSIQHGTENQLNEIADTGRNQIAKFNEVTAPDSIIEATVPSPFLQQSGVQINSTGYKEYIMEKKVTFGYLPVMDSVLFVSEAEILSESDFDYLARIKQATANIPVHFVLPNTYDEERIKEYFPEAAIFSTHSKITTISKGFTRINRLEKILFLLRKMISSLLKKRVEAENKLIDSISHNEEYINRLTGLVNNLSEKEKEQSNEIIDTFVSVKAEVNKVLSERIPEVLKNCSKFIKEDSNFNQLHIELNEKMNNEIQSFFDEEILPNLSSSLKEWIENSNQKLTETQTYLDEMTLSLTEGYPEKELRLQSDFKVVEDWRRDISRMTYRVEIEKENIMLRHNPAQVLLKSAGKVLGLLPQKQQTYLYNQYVRYVENAQYTEVTESIQTKFWQQFDFFKKSLEQDVSLFYKEPLDQLSTSIEETKNLVEQNKQNLTKMRVNPDLYYDPLKLFETKLVKYERINKKQWVKETSYLSQI